MSLIKAGFTKGEIWESGVWSGAGTVFMRLTATLTTFVIIYFLTLYEYGVFKLVLSLVGLFQIFVLSGLDSVVRNEMAHYLKEGNQREASKLFFEFVFLKGVLSLAVWIAFVLAIKIYFSTIYDSNFTNILMIASLSVLLNFLSDTFSLFYRGIGAIKLISKINSCIEVVKLGVFGLIFWTLGSSISSVIIAIVISQMISHVVYLIVARKDLISWWRWRGLQKGSLVWPIVKGYGKWSLATNVLTSLVSNSRNYIIKILLSTEAVAVWNLALSMMGLLYSLIPSNHILNIFMPYKVKIDDLKEGFYRSYVKYLTVAYATLMAVGWVGATVVINLFFPAYKPSLPIFYIMSFVLVLSGVNDFVAAYLHTLRHQQVIFYRTLQKSILTFTFMIVFVKIFGFVGLGIEYLLTTFSLVVFSYLSLIRIHPELKLRLKDFYFSHDDWKLVISKLSLLIRRREI